jgi:hypothetical protein
MNQDWNKFAGVMFAFWAVSFIKGPMLFYAQFFPLGLKKSEPEERAKAEVISITSHKRAA